MSKNKRKQGRSRKARTPRGIGTASGPPRRPRAAPKVAEPQVAEPQIAEPEVAEPEIAEPEIAEPEIAESEVAAGQGALAGPAEAVAPQPGEAPGSGADESPAEDGTEDALEEPAESPTEDVVESSDEPAAEATTDDAVEEPVVWEPVQDAMEAPDESPDAVDEPADSPVGEPVVGEPVRDEVEPPVEEPAESPTQDAVEEPVPISEPEPVPWPAAFEEPAGVGAPHPREWPWQEPEVTGRDDPASRRHRVLPILLAGLVLVLVVAGAAVAVHLLRGSGLGVVASSTPETRRYVAPVPVSAGTAFVSTEVLDPQSLRVTHWIHTDRPVSRVRISAPRVPGVAADAVGVSDLVVASGSQTVGGVTAPGPGSARVYVVPPGRWIYVSYVLTGVLQHSGTPAGRALAPLTALGVSTDQDPVVSSLHRVEGAQVLALACSSTRSPTALVRPCGTVHGGTWQVELHAPHTSDRVLAQMNLS